MAKFFSTDFYSRIVGRIEGRLSEEQFGFRRGRGCSDAVRVMRLIVEKSADFGEELWMAALDVEKAFDKVHHAALFEALLATCIDANVRAALRRLYCQMSGYVALWPGGRRRKPHEEYDEATHYLHGFLTSSWTGLCRRLASSGNDVAMAPMSDLMQGGNVWRTSHLRMIRH